MPATETDQKVAEKFKSAVESWNDEAYDGDQIRLHETYSGRFMYGRTCIGISGGDYSLTEFWADLPKSLRSKLGRPTKDSLGMGEIWYWPAVSTDSKEE